MDKNLNKRYQRDFDLTKDFVNAFDPCGLIKAGAPDDEYDGLIQQILSRIYNKTSRQEIVEFVLHETDHHFGCPVPDTHKTEFSADLDQMLTKLEKQIENNEFSDS